MEAVNQKLSVFRHFSLLNKLSDEQLIVLISRAIGREFRKGRVVMELGSSDKFDYFLLQGEILLTEADGWQIRVKAGSERARHPVAFVQPRKFEVEADSQCKFLVIDQSALTKMLREAPAGCVDDKPVAVPDDLPAYAVISDFYQDLQSQNIKLPSLPDLALRIREIAEHPASDTSDIARAILRDPSITAKLIRAANSPLYRGFKEIESCHDAAVRLGMETTRQLITVFTVRQLFNTSSAVLKKRMKQLWEHSVEVGVIALVLARLAPGLNAERAMLAGVLHDIGVIPVIQYLERHPELQKREEVLTEIITELRAEVGSELLKNWGFPEVVVEAVRHAEDYSYDSGLEKPNYADLVIIAHIHTFVGRAEPASLLSLEQAPAFTRLTEAARSIGSNLQVLQESRTEMDSLKGLMV